MSPDRRIITTHAYPPIPDRRFDWCAYREGDEEGGYGDYGQLPAPGARFGWGKTESEAISDLLACEEI